MSFSMVSPLTCMLPAILLSLAALWLFYGFPLADLRTFPQCSVPVRWPFVRC